LQNDFALKLTDSDFKNLVKKLKYDDADEFFVALGKNAIDIEYIHHHFYDKLVENKRNELDKNYSEDDKPEEHFSGPKPRLNVPINYASCCYPIPGDRIVGEIIENTEIKIHRRSCKYIAPMLQPQQPNIMIMNWEWLYRDEYDVKFKIKADANDEILPQITALILKEDTIPIKGINFNNDDNHFEGIVLISIKNSKQLDDLFDKIRLITGVKKVERFND